MAGIVCAIRGGPHSQPTIRAAIDLAKQTGTPLTFLYVVNLDFLAQTIMHHKDTMLNEMTQMGEFILLAAQERAVSEGVTADASVRHGKFMTELTALCHEVDASYVVLGRPRGEGSLLSEQTLNDIRHDIETETAAAVVWAGGDEA